MLCRLALLALLVVVSACDAPPREKEAIPLPVREKVAAAPLSKQQAGERSEQCGRMAREQFRRGWGDGVVNGDAGQMTAEFTNHYNAKLGVCFYLLTVVAAGTRKRMLFDVNGGEQYGEYLGPMEFDSPAAERPKACRVENFYCASGREWDVLAGPYMED